MILANRMAQRNQWSVDDESFFATNAMNVWQTLELISGLNLRKRYHYEGYSNTVNAIQTLRPSWPRDSFTEKAGAASKEESNVAGSRSGSYSGGVNGNGNVNGVTKEPTDTHDTDFKVVDVPTVHREPLNKSQKCRKGDDHHKQSSTVCSKNGARKKSSKKLAPTDPQYALFSAELTDLVKCNFNLPRISAALERLIGTNVVRLTDHKFMSELRSRLEEENRNQLESRIMKRALREVERERLLIIDGKTDEIPQELADDPIFVVNKMANKEVENKRSKLKTNRERNAEHLKAQGSKWEHERQKYVEEEQQRVQKLKVRKKTQFEFEKCYKAEDAERGMDLLRIDNEEWRECEQKLKFFLDEERSKMKERSLHVPTPFASDKHDLLSIVRARKKFREAEKRIRKQLEENSNAQVPKDKLGMEYTEKTTIAQQHVQNVKQTEAQKIAEKECKEIVLTEMSEREKEKRQSRKYIDDVSDVSTESEPYKNGSTISESKRRRAGELEAETEYAVERGYMISKAQFEQLRYHDDKILLLQQSSDMRELYQLAEEIIIGERVAEEVIEEEMGDVEEQWVKEMEEEHEVVDNNF